MKTLGVLTLLALAAGRASAEPSWNDALAKTAGPLLGETEQHLVGRGFVCEPRPVDPCDTRTCRKASFKTTFGDASALVVKAFEGKVIEVRAKMRDVDKARAELTRLLGPSDPIDQRVAPPPTYKLGPLGNIAYEKKREHRTAVLSADLQVLVLSDESSADMLGCLSSEQPTRRVTSSAGGAR